MFAEELRNRIRNVDLIEVAVAYANAVALHDPRGNTDCRAVRRDFLKNYGVGGDFGVVAYLAPAPTSTLFPRVGWRFPVSLPVPPSVTFW